VEGLAITREKKQELVADYLEQVSRAKLIIITDYRGLTVKQFQELRRTLAPLQASFQVTKNTLLKRALSEAGKPIPEELLAGTTAVSYCFGEIPAIAKAMGDFARTSNILQIKGGLLGNQIITAEGVRALADLPPREVLLARVVGGLQAPISGLVTVLSGPLRGLLNVLEARRRQLEEPAAA
jgi:large subunit ribosomal protein L10